MPIYEYQALDPSRGCQMCRNRFEVIQRISDDPLTTCPSCHKRIRRLPSRCHAAVVEPSEEDNRVKGKIREYEKAGMWSHAAELADKHSEKTKDKDLKSRALEDYRKAGYDVDKWAGDV